MFKYFKYIILGLLISIQVFAQIEETKEVQCFLTVAKGSCWKNYNVNIFVLDAVSGDKVVDIEVPKGELWTRKPFNCKPGETLSMSAKFSPEFWKGDEKKIFKALRFWKLPDKVETNTIGWNVTVCYPSAFSDVPPPPESSDKCECNLSSIPKVNATDINASGR